MKKSVKILPSLFIAIGTTLLVFWGYAIGIFFVAYPPARAQIDTFSMCFIVIFCGLLPTAIIVMLMYRGYYSVITINEKGIKRALFGVFMKVEMRWEEVKWMKYIWRVISNVFISTKEENNEMIFEQAIKRRDIIQIALSKKVLKAILQYSDVPIIGLSDEMLQSILGEKPKYDNHDTPRMD